MRKYGHWRKIWEYGHWTYGFVSATARRENGHYNEIIIFIREA